MRTKEEDRFYLPRRPEDEVKRWINTAGWTKVEFSILAIDEFPDPDKMYGRFLEGVDHLLFEDERDATIFKLTYHE